MYDYGARQYLPDVGRWFVMDKLSELQFRHSPYSYTYNNPIFFNDPTGMIGEDPKKTPEFINGGKAKEIDEVVLTKARPIQVPASYSSPTLQFSQSAFGGGMSLTHQINTNSYAPIVASSVIIESASASSGVLLADDVTGYGVADDVAIPVIWICAGVWVGVNELIESNTTLDDISTVSRNVSTAAVLVLVTAKASYEIERIMRRVKGPQGFQYALIANKPGMYPVYSLGSKLPTGFKYLNAGDVWKYGETTMGNGRYLESNLNSIGGGVTLVPQFYGNQMQIKIAEKSKIYGYFLSNGELPPGNKIFR